MTKELLWEAVKKMTEACEGNVDFGYGSTSPDEWYVSRMPPREVKQGDGVVASERYSPILSLCQLVDWCEAWLKGAEEMKAVFENLGETVPTQ